VLLEVAEAWVGITVVGFGTLAPLLSQAGPWRMRVAAAGREPPHKTPAASSCIHAAGTAGDSGSAGKGAATLTAVGTAASSAATVLGAGSVRTDRLYPVDYLRTTDRPSRHRRTSRNGIPPVRVRWR
jgi:hypothetical protein